MDAMGRDYLEKLSGQDIKIQNVSPAAVLTMIIAGEVPLSPLIANTLLELAKKKGAPVEWRPLEPVEAHLGLAGITPSLLTPCRPAFPGLRSLQGRSTGRHERGAYVSASGHGSAEKKFKKVYFDQKYSVEEYDQKYDELETLMKQLFIKKR